MGRRNKVKSEEIENVKVLFTEELSAVLRTHAGKFEQLVGETHEPDLYTIATIENVQDLNTIDEMMDIFESQFAEFVCSIVHFIRANIDKDPASILNEAQTTLNRAIESIRDLVSKVFEKKTHSLDKYCKNLFYNILLGDDDIVTTLIQLKNEKKCKVSILKAVSPQLEQVEEFNREITEFEERLAKKTASREKFRPLVTHEWVLSLRRRLL